MQKCNRWYAAYVSNIEKGDILLEQFNIFCKKKKNRAVIYLFPQLLFLIWLIGIKHIYYVTCDDVVINAMASGGYGEPTQYLCVVSPIFGHFVKWLFTAFPFVNWLGLTYIVLTIAGFFLIDIVFIKKETTFLRTLFSSLLILNCSFLIWTYFTFTVVAYACAIGGLFWCMEILRKENKILTWKIVPGWLLLSIGILIRTTAIYSLIIVIGFYAVFELLFQKKWRLFLVCVLIFCEVKAVGVINLGLNQQSEIQSEYIKWNSARSCIGDYLSMDEMAESPLFTETDAETFFNAFLWDRELFSAENMTQAAAGKQSSMRMDNLKQIYMEFINMFHDITGWNNYFCFYFILFWTVGLLELYFQKEARKKIAAIMFGALSTSFLFFVLGRMVYRVLMPGYVFAILCILWIAEDSEHKNRIAAGVYGLILVVVDIFMLKAYSVWQDGYSLLYSESNYQVTDYLEENRDKLFLPCHSNAYSLEMVKDVLEYEGEDYVSNLIGNWNIYSESYYNLVKLYDVQNPERLVCDIIDNDKIRLVMLGGEIPDYIIAFIEERTGQEVETELEDVISGTGYGDWNIYSVHAK